MTSVNTGEAAGLPAPQFTFSRYVIRAFQVVPKKRRVYSATLPRFHDRKDLAIYREVWLDKMERERQQSKRKKPDPYDEAVLQLLDALEDYLFGNLGDL